MIRGNRRPVRPTAELRAAIHNRFDVEVIDAATGALKRRARAYNIICDTLWNEAFKNYYVMPYMGRIVYGRGTGTPSAADTTLFDAIAYASTSNFTTTADTQTGVAVSTGYITLAPETAVGETLTEVGLGTTSKIYTHAMLQDMNGNPISIEKTATDVVKIYASVYLHWDPAGWDGGSITPADVDGMIPLAKILTGAKTDGSLYLSAVFFGYSGADSIFSGSTNRVDVTGAWSAAQKRYTFTGRAAVDKMNLTTRFIALCFGEDSLYPGSSHSTVLWLDHRGSWFTAPAITNEPVGTGDGTAQDFATAFPVASGATVYVDGVAAAATVRGGPPDAAGLLPFFSLLNPASTLQQIIYAAKYQGRDNWINVTETAIIENPYYQTMGVAEFSINYTNSANSAVKVETSDDLETWTEAVTTVATGGGTASAAIPSAHQNKRFFRASKFSGSVNTYCYLSAALGNVSPAENIRFSTPPAAGAVITCDYTPDCIAKDENHVFNLTFVLSLSEYQEG